MDREIIEVPVVSEGIRRLGAPVSALVRTGNLLFTCGMPPLDLKTGTIIEGDIKTQTRAALDALKYTLNFGGASLELAVRITMFIADHRLTEAMNEVYISYFRRGFPVRTCIAVQPWNGFDIEIECVAPLLTRPT